MWYIYIRTVSLFLINLSKSLLFAVQTIYRTVDLSGPVLLKCCRAVSVCITYTPVSFIFRSMLRSKSKGQLVSD